MTELLKTEDVELVSFKEEAPLDIPHDEEVECFVTCYYCQTHFNETTSLAAHIRQEHSDELHKMETEAEYLSSSAPPISKDRPWKCNDCEAAFARKCTLKVHVARLHTNVRPHTCPFCMHSFVHPYLLKRHIRVIHLEREKHKCEECGFECRQLKDLNVHIARKHQVYKCVYCACEIRGAAKDLIAHFREMHADSKEDFWLQNNRNGTNKTLSGFDCSFCGFIATTLEDLQKHIKDIHTEGQPFRCNKCDFSTDQRSALVSHNSESHNHEIFQDVEVTCPECCWYTKRLGRYLDFNEKFVCPSCGFQTTKTELLKAQADPLGRFICFACGIATADAVLLLEHSKAEHSDSVVCALCGHTSADAESAKDHRATHSLLPSARNSRKCRNCDFACALLKDLKSHMWEVHSERIHICQKCPYQTDHYNKMSRHLKIHNKQKLTKEKENSKPKQVHAQRNHSLKCLHCDYVCNKVLTLEIHTMRRHRGKRVYFREFCHKKFKKVGESTCEVCRTCFSKLDSHFKETHGTRNSHTCPYCEFEGLNIEELAGHFSESHTRVETHKCARCTFCTPDAKEYRAHLLGEHGWFCISCAFHLEELTVHSWERHTTHACGFCDFASSLIEEAVIHITDKHPGKTSAACKLCGHATTLERLITHANVTHFSKENCPKCSDVFLSTELVTHFSHEHVDNLKGACSDCNATSWTIKEFQAHVGEKHMTDSNSTCRVCDSYASILKELLKNVGLPHKDRSGNDCSIVDPLVEKVKDLKPESGLRCPFCEASIGEMNQVLDHVVKNHKSDLPSDGLNVHRMCPHCEIIVLTGVDLEEHVNAAHRAVEPEEHKSTAEGHEKVKKERDEGTLRKCSVCSKTFPRPKNLYDHMVKKHGVCPDCGFETVGQSRLFWHMKRMHRSSKSLKRLNLVKAHSLSTDSGLRKCPHCPFHASTQWCMRKHISSMHPNPERCEFCDYVGDDLFEHVAEEHEDKLQHQCPCCVFKSHTSEELMTHLRDSHGRNFQCPICHFQNKSLIDFNYHLEEHHPDKALFLCFHCFSIFTLLRNLMTHVGEEHLNAKVHECPCCDYCFYDALTLITHVDDTHITKDCLKCVHCDAPFTSVDAFSCHLKDNHLDVNFHKCVQCDIERTSVDELVSHIEETHLGVLKLRELECSRCDRVALSTEELLMHVRESHIQPVTESVQITNRTEERPKDDEDAGTKCFDCDFKSSSFEELLMHFARAHRAQKELKSCVVRKFRSHVESGHVDPQCTTCELFGFVLERLLTEVVENHFCPDCMTSAPSLPDLMWHYEETHANHHSETRAALLHKFNAHSKEEHTDFNCASCNTFASMLGTQESLEGTILGCRQCSQYVKILNAHVKSRLPSMFECLLCDANLPFQSLAEHIRVRHGGKDAYTCPVCTFSVLTLEELLTHLESNHAPHEASCKFCLDLSDGLLVHFENNHPNEEVLNCSECGFITFDCGAFVSHRRKIHTFGCYKCGFKSVEPGIMRSHYKIAHVYVDKFFRCTHCQYKGPSFDDFRTHMLSAHKDWKVYFCPVCDYRTGRKVHIRMHINRIHENPGPKECPHCYTPCSSLVELQRHVNSSHEGPFSCPYCDFCSGKTELKKHLSEAHTVSKALSCPVCSFTAASLDALSLHIDDNHGQPSPRGHLVESSAKTSSKAVSSEHVPINEESFNCVYAKCSYSCGSLEELSKHVECSHDLGSEQDSLLELEIPVENSFFNGSKCVFDSTAQEELATIIRGRGFDVIVCPVCKFKMNYPSELLEHLKKFHVCKETSNCSRCSMNIVQMEELCAKNPLIVSEKSNGQTKESACKFSVSLLDGLMAHYYGYHKANKDQNSECSLCRLGVNFTESVLEHIKEHHTCNRALKCLHCELCMSIFNELKIGNDRESGVHRCPVCDFRSEEDVACADDPLKTPCKFSERLLEELMAHSCGNHREASSSDCSLCGSGTDFAEGLLKHIKKEHMCEQSRKCEQCEFAVSIFEELKSVGNGSLRSCLLCTDFKCRISPPMVEELTINGSQVQSSTLECPVCKLTASSRGRLLLHMNEEHVCDEDLNCPNCELVTSFLSKLVIVLHECRHCEFKAVLEEELVSHIESAHKDGVPPQNDQLDNSNTDSNTTYQCRDCEFNATLKEELAAHVEFTHKTDIGPRTSGSEGSNKDELVSQVGSANQDAVLLQTNELSTAHKCGHCEFEAALQEQLVAHVKESHKDEQSDNVKNKTYKSRQFAIESDLPEELVSPTATTHNDVALEGPFLSTHLSTTHKCRLCEYKAALPEEIVSHVLSSHKDAIVSVTNNLQALDNVRSTNYNCSQCGFTANLQEELVSHVAYAHNTHQSTGHKCSFCEFNVALPEELVSHVTSAHKEVVLHDTGINDYMSSSYKCRHCEFEATLQEDLVTHVISAHKAVIHSENGHLREMAIDLTSNYKCCQCDFQSDLKEELLSHIASAHKDVVLIEPVHKTDLITTYKCRICQFKVALPEELVSHVSSAHKDVVLNTSLETTYKCYQGDFQSNLPEELVSHIASAHKEAILTVTDVSTPHKCCICEFKAALPEELVSHVSSAHKDSLIFRTGYLEESDNGETRNYKSCQLQEELVSQVASPQKDVVLAEPIPNTDLRMNYKCFQCDFQSNLQEELVGHIASTHKGDETEINDDLSSAYKCHLCEFKGALPEDLVSHVANAHFQSDLQEELVSHLAPAHKGVIPLESEVNNDLSTANKCHLCEFKGAHPEDVVSHIANTHFQPDVQEELVTRVTSVSDDVILSATGGLKESGAHLITIYKCCQCDFQSDLQEELVSHVSSVHKVVLLGTVVSTDLSTIHKCCQCDFQSDVQEELVSHVVTGHQDLIHSGKGHLRELGTDLTTKYKGSHCHFQPDFSEDLVSRVASAHKDVGLLEPDVNTDLITSHKCHLCEFKGALPAELVSHFESAHKDDVLENDVNTDLSSIFKCHLCEFKGTLPEDLVSHIGSAHKDVVLENDVNTDLNTIYKCHLCEFKGALTEDLVSHVASAHKDIVHLDENTDSGTTHKCNLCEFKGALPDLLSHIASAHKDVVVLETDVNTDLSTFYKCDHCEFKGALPEDLVSHVSSDHNDVVLPEPDVNTDLNTIYKCRLCEFKVALPEEIVSHVASAHKDVVVLDTDVNTDLSATHKCHLCEFKGDFLEELVSHVISAHKDVIVSLPDELRVLDSSLSTNYSCSHCDFKADLPEELVSHVASTHNTVEVVETDINPDLSTYHKCPQCEFKTADEEELLSHVESLHGAVILPENVQAIDLSTTHECCHCDFKSDDQDELVSHFASAHVIILIQSAFNADENTIHKCSYCDFSAALTEELVSHVSSAHKDNELRKAHKCRHCEFKSALQEELVMHVISTHKPVELHRCPVCEFTGRFEELKDHLKSIHGDIQFHKCRYCDFRVPLQEELLIHVVSTHKDMALNDCPHCQFTGSLKELSSHIDSAHHEAKIHKCRHCEFNTPLPEDILIHISSSHKDIVRHTCAICDFKGSIADLTSHVSTEHENIRLHECLQCDFKSILPEELTNHVGSAHEDDYECPQCEFVGPLRELKSHLNKSHDGVRKRKCPDCSFRAVCADELLTHLRTSHWKMPGNKCFHCKFRATTWKELILHAAKNHTDNDIRCPCCGLCVQALNDLSAHLTSTHPNAGPYKCIYCDFFSPDAERVVGHIGTRHYVKKKYLCPGCNYRTVHKDYVAIHYSKRHTDKNVRHCPLCDFTTPKADLKAHLHDKHPDKTFVCDRCGSLHVSRKGFRLHLLQKHGYDWRRELCDETKTDLPHAESRQYVDESHPNKTSGVDVENNEPQNPESNPSKPPHEAAQSCDKSTDSAEKCHQDEGESTSIEALTADYNTNKTGAQKEVPNKLNLTYKCSHCEFSAENVSDLDEHLKAHSATNGEEIILLTVLNNPPDEGNAGETSVVTSEEPEPGEVLNVSSENIHQCPYCDFYSWRLDGLESHMRERHGRDGVLVCPICDFVSPALIEMMTHISSHSEMFNCNVCDFAGPSPEEVASHAERAHPTQPFPEDGECTAPDDGRCPRCEFESQNAENLLVHVRGLHVGVRYHDCPHCEYSPLDFEELKSHMAECHKDDRCHICLQCTYRTSKPDFFIGHVKNIHGSDKSSCRDCDFIGLTEIHLNKHISLRHPLRCVEHKCTPCSLSFDNFADADAHMREAHADDDILRCQSCEFVTLVQGELVRHVSKFHPDDKRIVCPCCGDSIVDGTPFRTHILRTHIPNGLHKCANCNFKSTSFKQLKNHMNTIHKSDMCLKCPLCDYRTSTHSSYKLSRHIKGKHSTDRPYKCNFCSYSVKTSTALDNHKRSVHKGNKCVHCTLYFGSTEERWAHMRAEHRNQCLNACPFCKFRSPTFKDCLMHVEETHRKELAYQCTICGFDAPVLRPFLVHMTEEHSKAFESTFGESFRGFLESFGSCESLQCPGCAFSTSSMKDFKSHISDVHLPTYGCPRCAFVTRSQHEFIKHVCSQHGGAKRLKCTHCEFTSPLLEDLLGHARLNHVEHNCPHCRYTTNRFGDLKEHLIQSHCDSKCHFCPECRLRMPRPGELRKHFLGHVSQCLPLRSDATYKIEESIEKQLVDKILEQCALDDEKLKGRSKDGPSSVSSDVAENNTPPERLIDPTESMLLDEYMLSDEDSTDKKSHSFEDNVVPLKLENPVEYNHPDACPTCFTGLQGIYKHFTECHKERKSYRCPYCKYSPRRLDPLVSHFARRHSSGMFDVCQFCDFRSDALSEIKTHTRDCHSASGYCDVCSSLLEDFASHVAEYHLKAVPTYNCPRCDARSVTLDDLIEHFGFRHEGPGECKCPHCRLKNSTTEVLNSHVQSEHESSVRVCAKCDSYAFLLGKLAVHRKNYPDCENTKRRKHSEENPVWNNLKLGKDEIFECTHCSFSTTDKDAFRQHFRRHRFEKCVHCALKFLRFEELLEHLEEMHGSASLHGCPRCLFKTSDLGEFLLHLKSKHFYLCGKCEFKALRPEQLIEHSIGAHDSYACTECPYSQLVGGERGYKRLLIHYRKVHAIEWKCKKCGDFSTRYRKYLEYHHLRSHSKKQLFECAHCPLCTNYKKNLMHHILSKHLQDSEKYIAKAAKKRRLRRAKKRAAEQEKSRVNAAKRSEPHAKAPKLTQQNAGTTVDAPRPDEPRVMDATNDSSHISTVVHQGNATAPIPNDPHVASPASSEPHVNGAPHDSSLISAVVHHESHENAAANVTAPTPNEPHVTSPASSGPPLNGATHDASHISVIKHRMSHENAATNRKSPTSIVPHVTALPPSEPHVYCATHDSSLISAVEHHESNENAAANVTAPTPNEPHVTSPASSGPPLNVATHDASYINVIKHRMSHENAATNRKSPTSIVPHVTAPPPSEPHVYGATHDVSLVRAVKHHEPHENAAVNVTALTPNEPHVTSPSSSEPHVNGAPHGPSLVSAVKHHEPHENAATNVTALTPKEPHVTSLVFSEPRVNGATNVTALTPKEPHVTSLVFSEPRVNGATRDASHGNASTNLKSPTSNVPHVTKPPSSEPHVNDASHTNFTKYLESHGNATTSLKSSILNESNVTHCESHMDSAR